MRAHISLIALIITSACSEPPAATAAVPPEAPASQPAQAPASQPAREPDTSVERMHAKYLRELRAEDPRLRQGAALGLTHDHAGPALALAEALTLNHDLDTPVGLDTVYTLLEGIEKHAAAAPEATADIGRALFAYTKRLAWTPAAGYVPTEMQHINLPKTLANLSPSAALLQEGVASPDWQVRHLVALAIQRRPELGLAVLGQLRSDPHPEVRCAAAPRTPSDPRLEPRAYPACEGER